MTRRLLAGGSVITEIYKFQNGLLLYLPFDDTHKMQLSSLPNELVLNILRYLDVRNVLSFCAVSGMFSLGIQ